MCTLFCFGTCTIGSETSGSRHVLVGRTECSRRIGLHRFTDFLLPMTTMGKRWWIKKNRRVQQLTLAATLPIRFVGRHPPPPASASVVGAARRETARKETARKERLLLPPPATGRESRTGGLEMFTAKGRQHYGRVEDFSTTTVPELLHYMSNRWQEHKATQTPKK